MTSHPGGPMSTDPYSQLASHIIEVKALYCEDGCGMVETSSHGDDGSAADELAASGWKVVEHSMGCLTAVCGHCAARRGGGE